MTTYSTRNNAFTPAQVWEIAGESLQIREASQPPRNIPLREIAQVRLEYAPTRFETGRYRCELTTRQGGRHDFFSRTFEGAFNFRETKREYVAFVRELHAALGRMNPSCRYLSGASPARFWLGVACFGFAALVILGAVVFFARVGLHYIAVAKVVLMVVFIPIAFLWIRRNRPRVYRPDALPAGVMPRVD